MKSLSKLEKTALQSRHETKEPSKILESEKVLERKLVKWIKDAGGKCIKLSSQFDRGLPDRMILLPGGHMFYCELKSTGKKPTQFQDIVHKELMALGFRVYVVDNSEDLSTMLRSELLTKEKLCNI